MAGSAPSTSIPLPTGTLDAYRADLRAMAKESKAVVAQMTKDAKKNGEISQALLDKAKAIDRAIASQKGKIKAVETMMNRKKVNDRAEEARAANGGTTAWQKSIQGAMMLKHGVREIKRLDSAFKDFRAGGADIDKEQGVNEMLSVAQNIPGPIGTAARVMRLALHAVITIQTQIKEEAHGLREITRAFKGGVPIEDADDIKRRNSKEVEKKLSYVNPDYAWSPARADKAIGGGIDPAQFREDLARQIRNENAGIIRTIMQGLPLIGGHAQKGGKIWGADDEAKVNALVESALNQKLPELVARATQRASVGDFRGANRDLEEIRKIDPRLAPATNAEELFNAAIDRRQWATRKNIEQMGIRHIDGRDE